MDWRIYYGDGTTYSSDDGSWEEAPGWNIQVVLFRDPLVKWAVRHGGDFFRLDEDGTVVAMDDVGMLDYVVNNLGSVKTGRMLSQLEWKGVYEKAVADMMELQRE